MKRDEWAPVPLPASPPCQSSLQMLVGPPSAAQASAGRPRAQVSEGPRALVSEGPVGKIHKVLCIPDSLSQIFG